MGWPTGLEPATTRTTIWSSTIELRPPSSVTGAQILKSKSSFAKQSGLNLARLLARSTLTLRLAWKAGLQLDAGELLFRLVFE